MEQESIKTEIPAMENIENLELGTKSSILKARIVKVLGIATRKVTFENGEGLKLILSVKHPEHPEPLELSKVQYLKNKKVVEAGLWIKLDEEQKVAKNSAIAALMRFYGYDVIKDIVGKELTTIADDEGYLMVKAY